MTILFLSGLASAQDGAVSVTPEVVRFGWQPFGSSTKRSFTVANEGDEPVAVRIESVRMGDDFSPGQIESTCPLGSATVLAPGESCFHAIGFQPSEFFGGHEVARMRVTAFEADGDVAFLGAVRFTGTGYTAGDRTVDLSDGGVGPLDPSAFDEDGVVFLRGEAVALVQGDEALLGPVQFTTPDEPRAVTVSFAPIDPGAAWYQLAALDADGDVLAWTRALVEQDPADDGHVRLELVEVPDGTESFVLTSAARFGLSEILILE